MQGAEIVLGPHASIAHELFKGPERFSMDGAEAGEAGPGAYSVVCEESRRVGDRARREKIPAPPIKPSTFVHFRQPPF